MSPQKPLSLLDRFEPPHPSLTNPGRLMGLLGPIVGILRGIVNYVRHQLPMSNSITSQFVSHNLSRLIAMVAQKPFEKARSCCTIALGLEIHVNDFPILVNCPPEIVLLTFDLHEDFIDEECITITTVLSFKSPGVHSPELDTPQANRFAADGDASLSQQIFNISMAEIKSIVEPDGITNDIGRESVAFVCIHLPILSILESLLGNTLFILVPHRFDLIAAYGFITVFKLRENIPNLMIRKLPLNFFLNPPL
jgi:hypothetical protein